VLDCLIYSGSKVKMVATPPYSFVTQS